LRRAVWSFGLIVWRSGPTDEGGMVLNTTKQIFTTRATVALILIVEEISPKALVFPRGDTWYQRMLKVLPDAERGDAL
jgi:hypothetical protein